MKDFFSHKTLSAGSPIHRKIMEEGIHKTFHQGEIIIKEGSYLKNVPLVLSGAIKVMQTDEEGRDMLLYYIQPGESCIMSFLAGSCNGKSQIKAVADDEAEVLLIPMEKATKWVTDYPEWSQFIFGLYQSRFDELLSVIKEIAFKKTDERLWNYLKRKSELNHNSELHLTHEEIATDLGTARVVVSRLLKQLETEGKVKLGRNKINVL